MEPRTPSLNVKRGDCWFKGADGIRCHVFVIAWMTIRTPCGCRTGSRNGVGVSPSESNSQGPGAGTRWEGRFSLVKCEGGRRDAHRH
jgi:hypothetical protein